jgi:hypothetical protein
LLTGLAELGDYLGWRERGDFLGGLGGVCWLNLRTLNARTITSDEAAVEGKFCVG